MASATLRRSNESASKPSRRVALARGIKVAHFLALTEAKSSMLRWLVALAALLLVVNGLNVVNSYVGRDFMTAIVERQPRRYVASAAYYAGVFVASAGTAALYRFSEERLRLVWRESATKKLIRRYLDHHAFYRIGAAGEIDNPDQRITEDVKSFTAIALSIALLGANATITCVSFLGVLWSIDRWLVFGALGYAVFGSVFTIVFGRRLVALNSGQLKKEADLRYRMIRVRESAESITVSSAEGLVERHLFDRLARVVQNQRAIISVTRNVATFTGLYDYMVQLIPILIVAPAFLHGRVAFGVVTQSAMAFSQVMGALSLIVTQFETLSSFAAVTERLQVLVEATGERAHRPPEEIEMVSADKLAFEDLTLHSPASGLPVVNALTLEVPPGQGLLVTGPNPGGKKALFLAIAGICTHGHGRIVRPPKEEVSFLPQRPLTTLGPLRELVLLGIGTKSRSDPEVHAALDAVGLRGVVERIGGLDAKADWGNVLSLGDQQRVGFARLLIARPRFAFLDHVTEGIGIDEAATLLRLLSANAISCVCFAEEHDLAPLHTMTLELLEHGSFRVTPAREGRKTA